MLSSLIQKFWVGREGTKEDGYYRLHHWVPGVFELQIKHYSPELLEFYKNQLIREKSPWLRVIPRERAIPYNLEVLPSELMSHIIEDSDEEAIAALECMHRTSAHLEGKGCAGLNRSPAIVPIIKVLNPITSPEIHSIQAVVVVRALNICSIFTPP